MGEVKNVKNDKSDRLLRRIVEFGAVKGWDYKREQKRDV